ncbi:MAG: hypothetical protein KGZ86_04075 [Candidatus Latescibacteria bacterium]|nr:hypothetical protein [Candidatus Latescibacterota bacterium]
MKSKAIVIIGILVLLFCSSYADVTNNNQLSQNAFDKKAMQPGKPGAADVLTVTNNYYDLIVENVANNNGIGTFTVRTGTSHPATISMGSKQNVLYGGAYGNPWSTYLTVKSYTSNTNYYTGTGYFMPDTGCTGM